VQPRKSLALHALQGTTPQYEVGGAEDSPFVGGRPKMPHDLTEDAAAEWKRLVKGLSARRTVTRLDSSMLELHVRMWSRWKKVAALAEANPTTEVTWTDKNGEPHSKIVEHPASSMATKLENSLRNSLKEMSATPASRERAKPTGKAAPSRNQPPHPESAEGLALEGDRLRRALVAEQSQPSAPEPEPEIDLSLIHEEEIQP
jgi:P27 family predicted phage terminase small subunit